MRYPQLSHHWHRPITVEGTDVEWDRRDSCFQFTQYPRGWTHGRRAEWSLARSPWQTKLFISEQFTFNRRQGRPLPFQCPIRNILPPQFVKSLFAPVEPNDAPLNLLYVIGQNHTSFCTSSKHINGWEFQRSRYTSENFMSSNPVQGIIAWNVHNGPIEWPFLPPSRAEEPCTQGCLPRRAPSAKCCRSKNRIDLRPEHVIDKLLVI